MTIAKHGSVPLFSKHASLRVPGWSWFSLRRKSYTPQGGAAEGGSPGFERDPRTYRRDRYIKTLPLYSRLSRVDFPRPIFLNFAFAHGNRIRRACVFRDGKIVFLEIREKLGYLERDVCNSEINSIISLEYIISYFNINIRNIKRSDRKEK